MIQELRKGFNRVFYGTILVSFLSVAIPLIIALSISEPEPIIAIWFISYANIYVLWPLLVFTLIGLIILNLKGYGLSGGLEKSSLNILTVILAISLIYIGTKELKYRTSKLDVVFKNNSSRPIKNINLYGRHALTQLDFLAPYSDTTLIFRGRSILRNIENDYENEVTLLYYTDSTWFRQPILDGFGRWRVFNGPFQLDFYGPDTVNFEYLPKNKL